MQRVKLQQVKQTARQREFLAAFIRCGSVLASAKQIGISRQIVYYWQKNCPDFCEKFAETMEIAFSDSSLLKTHWFESL